MANIVVWLPYSETCGGFPSVQTLTYDDWANRLSEFFFDEAHAGEEVLFAVDEMTLSEVSGMSESDARQSLAKAVESVITTRWNVSAVSRLVRKWEVAESAGAHPALPFLALTVLGASRMGSVDGVPPHNFYVPLRRSLRDDDPETSTPGTYLDYVEHLWRSLEKWSSETLGGRRGLLVVRDPGIHYGRGYAQQHALVKSYDLSQLDAFFRRIGLEPGEEVAPSELLRALTVWTQGRPELWASRLNRVCADPELHDYARALLEREAKRWDGRLRDPRTGRAIGRLRIGFESVRRPTVRLFAQDDERLPERFVLPVESVGELEFVRDAGWYRPFPIESPSIAVVMDGGYELRGPVVRFIFRADPLYAMAYDDDLGCWVSVDSLSFGDRYHLLVRSDLVREVREFAAKASGVAPSVDEVASRHLPPGWKLITGFRLDARPAVSPPACMASMLPVGAGPRLRLVGGLPLTTLHGVYLRGGEPALALSTLSDDERIEILKESTGQTERFRITALSSREVALAQLQLDPDRYTIRHGDSRVSFQIVDGIADAAGPGAGSIRATSRSGTSVTGTIVMGGSVAVQPVIVPVATSGRSSILIGCRPEEVAEVSTPKWLCREVGFDMTWTSMDAWVTFEPVWVLWRGPDGYEAVAIGCGEPAPVESAAATVWGRWIGLAKLSTSASEAEQRLWSQYRVAAGAGL